MRRPELIFLHSVSADGSDVPACDFQKAGGALPRRSRSVSTGKLRCPAKEVRPHLIYAVCDEIEQTGDATRTGKRRARLIAALSDCVTPKRRRRAAPAAAVCCGAGTRSRNTDRQFWICASRWFPGWRRSLLIVKPETVCGTLAADPAGESPAGGNCPVATAMGRVTKPLKARKLKVSSWEASNSAGRSW